MNNDLISRSELKKAIENLVVGGAEGLKNYYENGSKSDENAWIGGVYDAWELIDNAPTIEQKYYERVVANITFDRDQLNEIVEKAKAEILENIERPKGEWIFNTSFWTCSVCKNSAKTIGYCGDEKFMNEFFKFCPNCGANMSRYISKDKEVTDDDI